MRFIVPFSICITISIFLWQSFDIQTYQSHHRKVFIGSSAIRDTQVFLENVRIVRSPQKEDWLIQYIDWAQKEIKIAVYMFTLPSMREALLRAQKRGVSVEVILEKDPYNATHINRETIQFFQENKIDFYETDNQYFSFMHAKYIIIDTTWIIATANWTRSSFSSNREFFIVGEDALISKDLKNIFENDFWGKSVASLDNRLIVWPTHARERLIKFIQWAQEKIYLYMPSLTDEEVIVEFQRKCQEWKMIYILLDKSGENDKKGNKISQKWCPEIRLLKSPSLHAKALIVDNKEWFVGSFNFTKNSLENNREIGIFISGKSISNIVNIFQQDWKKSIAF